jgi:hypothetical protein
MKFHLVYYQVELVLISSKDCRKNNLLVICMQGEILILF